MTDEQVEPTELHEILEWAAPWMTEDALSDLSRMVREYAVNVHKSRVAATRVERTSEWMAARALILSTSEWWDGMTDAARRGAVDNAAAILTSQPERVECPTNHTCMDNYDENGDMTKILWSDDAIGYEFCPDCGQSFKGAGE